MEKQENKATNPKKNKQNPFTTVTPFSRLLALMLFVTLPFVGFLLGYNYAPEKVVEIEMIVNSETENEKGIVKGGEYYSNEYGFSFKYPENWGGVLEEKSVADYSEEAEYYGFDASKVSNVTKYLTFENPECDGTDCSIFITIEEFSAERSLSYFGYEGEYSLDSFEELESLFENNINYISTQGEKWFCFDGNLPWDWEGVIQTCRMFGDDVIVKVEMIQYLDDYQSVKGVCWYELGWNPECIKNHVDDPGAYISNTEKYKHIVESFGFE